MTTTSNPPATLYVRDWRRAAVLLCPERPVSAFLSPSRLAHYGASAFRLADWRLIERRKGAVAAAPCRCASPSVVLRSRTRSAGSPRCRAPAPTAGSLRLRSR